LSLPEVRVEALQLSVEQQAHDERTRSALRAVHALYDLGRRFFSDATGLQTPAPRTDSTLYTDAVASILKYEPDLGRLRAVLSPKRPLGQQLLASIGSELRDAVLWAEGHIPHPSPLPPGPPLKSAASLDVDQAEPVDPVSLLADIQGNILSGYNNDLPGKLLLFQCDNAAALRTLLQQAHGSITSESRSRTSPLTSTALLNLGITYSGLKLLGLPAGVLEEFPREFREGMEERAGVLGDVAHNHPSLWRLPLRPDGSERVHLSAIHVAMLVFGKAAAVADRLSTWQAPKHGRELVHVLDLDPSVQPERSQPVPPKRYRRVTQLEPSPLDIVPLSEFVLGYENKGGRAAAAFPRSNAISATLFKNGTFLAMRKMQQDETALEAYVDQVMAQVNASSSRDPARPVAELREEIKALIFGRKPNGDMLGTLQPPPTVDPNAFDFSGDAAGNLCPYHSHIRRANPRTDPLLRQAARIVRRGRPYPVEQSGPEKGEHGLLFLAYCASLAEQYEKVQRYVNGGNSTGLLSKQNDLLCGAPLENNVPRFASLLGTNAPQIGNHPATINLPDRTQPLVTLRWGIYLFVPSLSAVQCLTKPSVEVKAGTTDAGAVARGKARIDEIARLPGKLRVHEWKRLLEEVPEGGSAQARHAQDVAAAITEAGGALLVRGDPKQGDKAPNLVVVTTEELARKVLSQDRTFSVCEYRDRLQYAVEDHYLGYDVATVDTSKTGRTYAEQSTRPNQLLKTLEKIAFADARREATTILDNPGVLDLDPDRQSPDGSLRSTISVRDLASAVVAKLCNTWLDMPGLDGKDDIRALMKSLDRFLIASRYCFQAMPVDYLKERAHDNQKSILADYAGVKYEGRIAGKLTPPPPAARRRAGPPTSRATDKQAFRRMAVLGAVGFAPPAVGAITRILDQWIETDELWQIQKLWKSNPSSPKALLLPAIYTALANTPAPPTLYRTVVMNAKATDLGNVKVPKKARVIVNLAAVYADACRLNKPIPEAWFFGGQHGGAERKGDNPPHGCPAREAGELVMAGIIGALLERTNLRRERRFLLSYDATVASARAR
jgi:deferrochelatase/peroxidase EfeB